MVIEVHIYFFICMFVCLFTHLFDVDNANVKYVHYVHAHTVFYYKISFITTNSQVFHAYIWKCSALVVQLLLEFMLMYIS